MVTYIVTCTNTYRIQADNKDDAIKIANALDAGNDYPETLGFGKNIQSDTEAEEQTDPDTPEDQ